MVVTALRTPRAITVIVVMIMMMMVVVVIMVMRVIVLGRRPLRLAGDMRRYVHGK